MKDNRMIIIVMILSVLFLLCACGGRKEMSNQVIVQNEVFTLTGDSLIEDTVFAYAIKPDRIETNITMNRLESLYLHVDSAKIKFVHGRPWHMRQSRPTMMPEYESDQPLIDALYNMSVERIADAIDSYALSGSCTPIRPRAPQARPQRPMRVSKRAKPWVTMGGK